MPKSLAWHVTAVFKALLLGLVIGLFRVISG